MVTRFGWSARMLEKSKSGMREKQQQKATVYISDRSSTLSPKPSTLKQKTNHQSEPDRSIGKPLFLKLHQTIHQKPRSREIPSITRNPLDHGKSPPIMRNP